MLCNCCLYFVMALTTGVHDFFNFKTNFFVDYIRRIVKHGKQRILIESIVDNLKELMRDEPFPPIFMLASVFVATDRRRFWNK